VLKRLLLIGLLGLFLSAAFSQAASPVVQSEFIFDQRHLAAPFSHAPTIAETPSGLVVAWFAGRGEGSDTKIYISRTGQDWTGWTAPVAVADGGTLASWNPVLFQPRHGPLFLFYKIGSDPRHWQGRFKVSVDDGRTWSSPFSLPEGILGPTKNKPLELADGTILCPSSRQSSRGWEVVIERIRPAGPDDLLAGKNWAVASPLNGRSLMAIQPALLDLGGGKILLLARNRQWNPFLRQSIVQAGSTDGGLHWSSLTPSRLPNPNSGIDVVGLQDGRSLLVYNPTWFFRTPLGVALSADQGRTWKYCLSLEAGRGEYSYPAVIQSHDGLVHIVYTWKKQSIRHVVLDPRVLS
jgi:alpha-L-rhamnosidase